MRVCCGQPLWFHALIISPSPSPFFAFSPSLSILSQRCLVHLRNRGCLATYPPLSRTMDSFLIVGVCTHVCIHVWECLSTVISYINPCWMGHAISKLILCFPYSYHSSISLWQVCPCLLSLAPLDTQLVYHWHLLMETSLTHWPPPGDTDRNPANQLLQQRDRQRESERKGVRWRGRERNRHEQQNSERALEREQSKKEGEDAVV